MRQTALFSVLSLLLVPAAASADPDRLNNPAPPPVAPGAPPPDRYAAPPPVGGYAAPPPVGGYMAPPPVQGRTQPVMMSPAPMPLRPPMVVAPPPPPARQGLFVGVQGGAAIPLAGGYSSVLGTGFMGLGHIGWATPSGISVRAELGVRSNSFTPDDLIGASLTSVFYGAGLRYTAPRGVFRPFGEVLVDAFSTLATSTDSSGTTTSSSAGATGVTLGAAVGAEIEVSSTFSLELAVRYDHVVVAGGTEGLTGGLLGVLGGGSFYF
jgi:hypothetical protein